MTTKKPTVNIVLEKFLYETIKSIAKKQGKSISYTARELLHEALEIYEDRILENISSEREKTFNWNKALTHDEIWKC